MHYASDEWLVMASQVHAFDMAFCLADDCELCGVRLENIPKTDVLQGMCMTRMLHFLSTKLCLLCLEFIKFETHCNDVLSYLWQGSKCGVAIGYALALYEIWVCTMQPDNNSSTLCVFHVPG